jgi:hypothetical protein
VNGSTNQRWAQLEQRTVRPWAPSEAGLIRNVVRQLGQVMIIAAGAGGPAGRFALSLRLMSV